MTPLDVLAEVEGLGFRLAPRPGGLRLKGAGAPPPALLALIAEHREPLLILLADEARRWAAHEASLAAGRVTPFPEYLAPLVGPVLVRACAEDGKVCEWERVAVSAPQRPLRRVPGFL